MASHQTIRNLPNNSRFYILVCSVLGSLLAVCVVRSQVVSDQLFYIRTEQVYGVISLAFLYVALMISPLSKLFAGKAWMGPVLFARRAIGVSAAYFGLLHAGVALWGQLDGLQGAALLPQSFRTALVLGLIALVVLFLMAATSFDKVIKFMTFRRWKWLHRLVYMGGILLVVHIWMIGSLMVYPGVRIASFVLLGVFFALESWRTVTTAAKKYPELQRRDYLGVLAVSLWAFWLVLLACLPGLVQNYHDAHRRDHGDVHTTRHQELIDA